MRAEACMSIISIDISDIGLAIMAQMSEVNDEKIQAPKHVRPWSVRYLSGRADEWSVLTSDWVKVKFDDEVVRWWWYRIRGKACESGWCACDSLQKVPAIRHLGEGHGEHWKFLQPSPVTFPEMPLFSWRTGAWEDQTTPSRTRHQQNVGILPHLYFYPIILLLTLSE